METKFLYSIHEQMSVANARMLGAGELAYVGDTVYDLYIRTRLLHEFPGKVGAMHKIAIKQVCAHAQAMALDRIIDSLSEDEQGIVRRGRNTKHQTLPKNCDPGEYCKATALEALIGFLYLSGQNERIQMLITLIFDKPEDK